MSLSCAPSPFDPEDDPPAGPSTPPHIVVFIQGACVNPGMWAIAREAFAPRFACLTPELPGHGRRAAEPFRLEQAVRELDALLAPCASLSLVGESLGGYTAMALAPRLGSRLKSLVVSGASSNFTGISIVPWRLQSGATNLAQCLLGRARVEQAAVRKLLAHTPPRLATSLLRGGLRLDAFDQAVGELRRHGDFRKDIARVDAPVLFVNGSRDTRQVLQERTFVAATRRAESKRFAGAEHGVSLWNAEELASTALNFITRHVH